MGLLGFPRRPMRVLVGIERASLYDVLPYEPRWNTPE